MQIIRIVLQNFMSYEYADIPLANRGLVLVEGENKDTGGSNGAGKSAIFEGLYWGLFGKSLRDYEVSRNGKGGTLVYLEVEIDGVLLKIYRGKDHDKYASKLFVWANDTPVTMGTNKETQTRLDEFLQLDSESFVSAVMFPQGASGFASMTDSGQKEVLDSVLGMERFARAHELVKADLAANKKSVTSAKSYLQGLKAHTQTLSNDIEALKLREVTFVQEQTTKVERFEAAVLAQAAKEPKIDESLPELQKQLLAEANPTAMAGERAVLSNTQTRLAAVRSQIQTSRERRARLQAILSDAPSVQPRRPEHPSGFYKQQIDQVQVVLNQLDLLIRQHDRQVQDLSAKLVAIPTNCDACGQKMPETARQHAVGKIQTDLTTTQRALAEHRANREAKHAEFTTAQDFYYCALTAEAWDISTSQREELAQIESYLEVSDGQIGKLEALIQSTQEKIHLSAAKLMQANELASQYARQKEYRVEWLAHCESLTKQLEEARNATSPFQAMIDQKQVELAKVRSQIHMKQLAVDELAEIALQLDYWAVGFSNKGVKSLLLDSVVPILNRRATEYMEILSGGACAVTFHTTTTLQSGETRDKFNVAVSYAGGADSYKGTSGGERRRVDISTLFALGDLASTRSRAPVQLRLLDEPFENLDSLGNEQVVQLLKEKVLPRSKTILVMTHDESLKSLFQNRILVVKENGTSRIVEN